MKSILTILCVLLAGVAQAQYKRTQTTKAPVSFASSVQNEVDLTMTRLSLHSSENVGGDKNTTINIYGGFHRNWQNNMQWGVEGGLLSYPDGNDTKTLLAAMGMITYNLDSNYRNAFYVQGGLGLHPGIDDNEYKSAFSMTASFGKRMEVWGKINYKPYARIAKYGDEDVSFEIQALNFSIFY
jgi:hypothetical protein